MLFSEPELKQRLDFMKLRYTTFKAVVGNKGASWDVQAEFVRANDELWEKILKVKKLCSRLHITTTRPTLVKACMLVRLGRRQEGMGSGVVVISDRIEKICDDEPSCYEVGGIEGEVSSTFMPPPPKVSRKLFADDVEPPTDRESTTDFGIYFIDLDDDGQLRTRFEKGRALLKPPTQKKDAAGPSTRSHNASSCASNLPLRWWPHIHKRPNF
ncbi:hypothetical protein SASPL_123315 [Salvia splendens]|uniref:Myb/SANT-like domain-containing protein n=1 Tax=Salvia splendens TaxID=180675 RepID=A0A8X8XKW0_SALSN|nr:hypothetical protein SASPL_123315 [Salvia splendens]